MFLLYPYYWPLYKAGGPIQSLYNLVGTFKNEATFYLISLNRDIDDTLPAEPLQQNAWTKGPHGEKIYTTSFITPYMIFRLVREVQPDVLLVNGIFHWHTSFFGLLTGKVLGIQTILSPRGMLQQWALLRGRAKKRFFLWTLKLFVGQKDHWHATDKQEEIDIHTMFGASQHVHIASNIPRAPAGSTSITFPDASGQIKLVFLSLINPNKNLHLIIDAVNQANGKFTLDIYGPVIDKEYWELCKSRISNAGVVGYKGPVPPWQVSETLQQYHFFVLPTQGENFGHAIFDALASGVPVIISHNNPWTRVIEDNMGLYVDTEHNDLDAQLEVVSRMKDSEYSAMRVNALKFARQYWTSKDYAKEYGFLFK